MQRSIMLAALAAAMVTVTPASATICDFYASANNTQAFTADSEYDLVSAIVSRAVLGNATVTPMVAGLIAPGSPTVGFFDASTPTWRSAYMNNSESYPGVLLPNYTMGGAPLVALLTHLNQFFGQTLGCTATNFTTKYAYTGGSSMASVHSAMPITPTVFNSFVLQVVNSARSFGVSVTDGAGITSALNAGFNNNNANGQNICNTNCVPPPSSSSSTGGGNSPTPSGGNNTMSSSSPAPTPNGNNTMMSSSSTGRAGNSSTGLPNPGSGGDANAVSVSVASTFMAAAAAVFAMRR